ncbi:MFS transporter [Sandaracinobacteroides saxicola]|nr:MFS transporter [Sandaracinobacteroides saxicola]
MQPRPPSAAFGWLVVLLLCVGQVISMLDRQVLNLLVEPVKADLGLSDVQISLLQGLALTLFYALAAVPLGRMADSGSRTAVIAGGALLFGLATFGSGLALGFATLFLARLAVGVGEATLTPAGVSLIGDAVDPRWVGRAIALFIGCSFVGSGLALIIIGGVLDALDRAGTITLPLIGAVADWRAAFMLAALPALAFALAMLLLPEPPRRISAGDDRLPASAAWAWMRAHPGAIVPLLVGLPLLGAAQFALNAWAPTLFIRIHGWTPGEIGRAFGLLVMIGSTGGVLAGGALADWLRAKGRTDAPLLVCAGAALLAAPFAFAFTRVDGAAALWLLAPAVTLGAMPFGAGPSALALIAPNRLRAQLMALYMLLANLVGGGGGPTSVALLTDRAFADPMRLPDSIAIVVPLAMLAGAAALLLGRPAFARHSA